MTHESEVEPLSDEKRTINWIADITGESAEKVTQRLEAEFRDPGFNVASALRRANLKPYVWCDGLVDFYRETDSFLFELVIWNMNLMKVWLRDAVIRLLKSHLPSSAASPARILNIGDGLGVDSVSFARSGYAVTYFEYPGPSEQFARRVFDACSVHVEVLTDETAIRHGAFDAVVCLDVLEHVPDPPAFVRRIAEYLRPGGLLLVNAPFMVIHPSTATHLQSNRRFAGKLSLYTRSGFDLLDGELGWNPLVVQKTMTTRDRPNPWRPKRLALRASGWVQSIGRWPVVPLGLADRLRRSKSRWFGGLRSPARFSN